MEFFGDFSNIFSGIAPGFPREFLLNFLSNSYWSFSGIPPGVFRELLQEFLADYSRSSSVISRGSSGIISPGVPREFFVEFFGDFSIIFSGIPPGFPREFPLNFLGNSYWISSGIPREFIGYCSRSYSVIPTGVLWKYFQGFFWNSFSMSSSGIPPRVALVFPQGLLGNSSTSSSRIPPEVSRKFLQKFLEKSPRGFVIY